MPTSHRMRVDCLGLDPAACAGKASEEALRHGYIVDDPRGGIESVIGYPTLIEYDAVDGHVYVTWTVIESTAWADLLKADPEGYHLAVCASVKHDAEGRVELFKVRDFSIHQGVLE